MKEFKVQLNLFMEYTADTKEEVEQMLEEEFELGDKTNQIFIEEYGGEQK